MGCFRLKVQRIENTCLFELSWGQGQQLTATVGYPANLTTLYQEWQRAYISFYKTAEMPIVRTSSDRFTHELRARVVESGQFDLGAVDWHAKLVQAETSLLNAFHHWLRSAELFELRAAMSTLYQSSSHAHTDRDSRITDIFLTCYPLELARFPWEAWEIGADFATRSTIRIIRTPATVLATSVVRRQRSKARILAILGDDTGLNFQGDREAVQALSKIAEICFVGWQPGQRPNQLKQHIQDAITDAQGWDVLFFAGHSNETAMTGGELAIAPNVSLQLAEIAPHLTIAKQQGLQVAIFNSCSGLNIAEYLISLGFNQVIVMREPIHNRVAQEFLLQFLHGLAAHHTLQDAMLAATQYLRLERNLTYPSSYLVPSLFAHPGADLFQIPPVAWKQRLRQFFPTRLEAGAIAVCLTLSLLPSVQNWLLEQRVGLQAVYRDLTHQVPPATPPPVALVQIDEESIRRDTRIAKPTPISRSYLADLVTQLTRSKAAIIGIDYLLDRPVGEEATFNQAIRSAIEQHRTWFVFGAPYSSFDTENIFVVQQSGIAQPEWTMQAYVYLLPNYVTLPYPNEDCRQSCPFAYLLALLKTSQQEIPANTLPQPDLNNTTSLRMQLIEAIEQARDRSKPLAALERSRFSPISTWIYDTFGLVWLEPLIDFSIPPDRIYTRIAAWRILHQPLTLPHLQSQVVLIGAGEYKDAGGTVGSDLDVYPVTMAVRYWRSRLGFGNSAASFPYANSKNTPAYLPVMTGSEIHAYILHHLLTHRLVVPIPDVWLVGVAALIGKSFSGSIRRSRDRWTPFQRCTACAILVGSTGAYGLASLQLYITGAILLPWLLPSLMLWSYILLSLRKGSHG